MGFSSRMSSVSSGSHILVTCLIMAVQTSLGATVNINTDNDGMHAHYGDWVNPPYQGPVYDWKEDARNSLQEAVNHANRIALLTKKAKNVIFMMGDGMGISTITAARIYKSQKEQVIGRAAELSWERLPNVALSRTYATDAIVPDSAATATAMLCSEKTVNDVICTNQFTRFENCSSWVGNNLTSVMHEAAKEGKWTGVISTARITHASPACAYATTPSRDWEADSDMDEDSERVGDNSACTDIAKQLILDEKNKDIRVILGGGRRKFYLSNETDPEYPTKKGDRLDQNLVQMWLQDKMDRNLSHKYITNLTELNSTAKNTEYILGLFEPDHMQYELDRVRSVPVNEPSLSELVQRGITMLSRSPQGYFLFVEGGRVDHAHHDTNAKRALEDTLALSEAVQKAIDLTNETDTMIIVTADHSHVFTIAGYPDRNTDILTFDTVHQMGNDAKPYGTLSYANGPGFNYNRANDSQRMNLTGMQSVMRGDNYKQDAAVPLFSETHGGEDVGIFARGPMAHLFHGTQEQSYISHVMRYAMCVGEYAGANCQLPDTQKESKPGCAPNLCCTLLEIMVTLTLVVLLQVY